jgi:hypothetical protein
LRERKCCWARGRDPIDLRMEGYKSIGTERRRLVAGGQQEMIAYRYGDSLGMMKLFQN